MSTQELELKNCITCSHSDAHDAAGIGICRSSDCGCDGPTTAEYADSVRMWRELRVYKGDTC